MEGFNPRTPPPKWEGLLELAKPALPTLAHFIHHCSPDPATRTNAVIQLITSVWQLAGRKMTPRLPSLITVNPHHSLPDSGDQLASRLLASPGSGKPQRYNDGAFALSTPEHAPMTMTHILAENEGLEKHPHLEPPGRFTREEIYYAAQRTGFGYGPTRRYAEAWHDPFQLITDRGDEVVLRLEDKKDRDALRKDVVEGVERLRQPCGYGTGLQIVPKHIALSGTLIASEWDSSFAVGLVNLGLPLLILPGTSQCPLEFPDQRILETIALLAPRACFATIDEPANFIQNPWFEVYSQELRRRLRHLPGTYEYSLHKMARQLFPVCLHIADWCGTNPKASTKEILAVSYDLCEHGMRGLVLSVAGLAWHGLGIDAGCPQKRIVKVLEYLRSREPMSKSQLMRGAHLEKEERDRIVACFEKENLIRVDAKVITATSYAEFVKALHSRSELPEPQNHWAEASRKNQEAS